MTFHIRNSGHYLLNSQYYLLRALMRHRRTSMFFETWVLWGDAWFFTLFAFGHLSLLLLGWTFALADSVVVPAGWILATRGYILSPSCRFRVSLRAQ